MNFVEDCPECKRLSGKYEAATIEWFRIQQQLGIAEHLRDPKTSAKIVSELASLAKVRQLMRASAEHHLARSHAAMKARGG